MSGIFSCKKNLCRISILLIVCLIFAGCGYKNIISSITERSKYVKETNKVGTGAVFKCSFEDYNTRADLTYAEVFNQNPTDSGRKKWVSKEWNKRLEKTQQLSSGVELVEHVIDFTGTGMAVGCITADDYVISASLSIDPDVIAAIYADAGLNDDQYADYIYEWVEVALRPCNNTDRIEEIMGNLKIDSQVYCDGGLYSIVYDGNICTFVVYSVSKDYVKSIEKEGTKVIFLD